MEELITASVVCAISVGAIMLGYFIRVHEVRVAMRRQPPQYVYPPADEDVAELQRRLGDSSDRN